MILRNLAQLAAMLLFLSACGTPTPNPEVTGSDAVKRLEAGLMAMGPDIDPEEAARAAEIAYSYTRVLAEEYEIVDPPLVHNTKVNMGLKPRGLCWHWAEDMQKRFEAEDFQTLDVLRAIATAPFRIDHSTVLLSPDGGDLSNAMVIDPWRFGGQLYWGMAPEDDRYAWRPQLEVLAEIRARKIRKGELPAPIQ